jgi:hypothetical protein
LERSGAVKNRNFSTKRRSFSKNVHQEMQNAAPLGTTGLAVLATTTSAAATFSGTVFALLNSLALFKLEINSN